MILPYSLVYYGRLFHGVKYSVRVIKMFGCALINRWFVISWAGDMFDCCDSGFAMSIADDADQVLDLDERAEVLNILLSLLHSPPPPPPPKRKRKYNMDNSLTTVPVAFEPDPVIPFPLLPRMLQLADKYALSENLQHSLLAHMSFHASAYPLQVYAFAMERGLQPLAVDASKHLLHPRLSAYSPKDIKIMPSPDAWQKLVLLHDVRIRGLRAVLLGEEIFPHGYGTCSSHKDKAIFLWGQRKTDIILKVDAGERYSETNRLPKLYSSCVFATSH
jgi:hypothetical protein